MRKLNFINNFFFAFLVFYSLCTWNSYAQEKKIISFQLNKIPPEKQVQLILRKFENEDFLTADSAILSENSPSAQFKINNPNFKLFDLSVKNNANKAEFIYSSSDNNLSLSADYNQLKNGSIEISNSNENKSYADLLNVIYQFDTLLSTQFYKLNGISVFSPGYKMDLLKQEEFIEHIFKSRNMELSRIKQKYPGTYTSDVLIPLTYFPERPTQSRYDGFRSFLNEHYFDSVDFNNPAILKHYAFSDKIFKYLSEYTEKTTDGTIKGIDVIMNSRKNNPEVNDFLFNYLLKSFIDLKTDVFANYLMEKYSNGCSLKLGLEDMKRFSKMKALSVGGFIPEISLPDSNNKYFSLKTYASEKKFTILYFWISWCAKCKKQTPQISELFTQFRKKGLGVYAVSLDEKKEEWVGALNTIKADYINVSELVPIKNSSTGPLFNISTTPKIFIINKEGKVVGKDIYGEELNIFISNLLKN